MTETARRRSTSQGNYTVGYGRPPEHTRFRKGRSGNPRGRRRGDTRAIPPIALSQALRKAAGQPVSMTVDGCRTRTTLGDAIIHQLLARALKGDHRSTKLFCDLVRHTETGSEDMSHEEWLEFLDGDEQPNPATDVQRARAVAALLSKAKRSEHEE
jgi:Family of unknown function (DUF5681)